MARYPCEVLLTLAETEGMSYMRKSWESGSVAALLSHEDQQKRV